MTSIARPIRQLLVAAILWIAVGSACGSAASADATRYVSADGSDANPCTASSPCLSFDRGFHAAPCGGIVDVAAGAYPPQEITPDPATANCRQYTVITPAPNADVTVNGSVEMDASYVEVLGTETAADVAAGRRVGFDILGTVGAAAEIGASSDQDVVPDHVLIEGTNSKGGYVGGATNVTFKDTNIGPATSCLYGDACAADVNGGTYLEDLFVIRSRQSQDGTVHPDTNVVLDGVWLHDLTKLYDECSTYPVSCRSHADCLQVYSFDHLTIANSHFWNCSDTDFFIRAADGTWAPFHDLTITNNQLGEVTYPTAYYDAQIVGACSGVVFQYNTVVGHNVALGCPAAPLSTVVEGNVLTAPGYGACSAAIWRFNFLTAADATPCGSSDAVVAPKVFATTGSLSGRSFSLPYVVVAGTALDVRATVSKGSSVLKVITLRSIPPATGHTRILKWRATNAVARGIGYHFCIRVSSVDGGAVSSATCAQIDG